MRKIVFITKSPFSQRDYRSFGIELLSKENEIQILDFSEWIVPKIREAQKYTLPSGMQKLKSLGNFLEVIVDLRNLQAEYYVDYLEDDLKSLFIRFFLKFKNVKRVYVISGPMPGTNEDIKENIFFRKLIRAYKEGRLMTGIHAKMLAPLKRAFIYFGIVPDIVVCSGSNCNSYSHAQSSKVIIWAHTFDYDIYLQNQNTEQLLSNNYAVFIDQAAGCHPDVEHIGLDKNSLAGKDYYTTMNFFFDRFEKEMGLEVVIAGHPKADPEFNKQMFANRKLFYNKTAQLIKDSKIVFEHTSTARSFAILWGKPIVCLTSNYFKANGQHNYLIYSSQLLDTKLINLDELPTSSLAKIDWFRVNREAFQKYKEEFLKMPNTPELPLWQIFSDYINSK